MLDSYKTGWKDNFSAFFPDFDTFKSWYDKKYTGEDAETIWKKTGGTIEEVEEETNEGDN